MFLLQSSHLFTYFAWNGLRKSYWKAYECSPLNKKFSFQKLNAWIWFTNIAFILNIFKSFSAFASVFPSVSICLSLCGAYRIMLGWGIPHTAKHVCIWESEDSLECWCLPLTLLGIVFQPPCTSAKLLRKLQEIDHPFPSSWNRSTGIVDALYVPGIRTWVLTLSWQGLYHGAIYQAHAEFNVKF